MTTHDCQDCGTPGSSWYQYADGSIMRRICQRCVSKYPDAVQIIPASNECIENDCNHLGKCCRTKRGQS